MYERKRKKRESHLSKEKDERVRERGREKERGKERGREMGVKCFRT